MLDLARFPQEVNEFLTAGDLELRFRGLAIAPTHPAKLTDAPPKVAA